MKIINTLLNQSIRLLTPASSLPGEVVGRPELLRLMRNLELKYGFLQGPRVVAEYNLESGITFLEGQFGTMPITKLSVHGNGVLAEANASTDVLDEFIDDLMSWANEQLGCVIYTEPTIKRAYLSQFEMELDVGLGAAFSEFVEIGRRIAVVLKANGQNVSDFEVNELSLHCDITALQPPKPGPSFSIARRAAEPYNKRLYFASAPLPTKMHIELIRELEQVFIAKLTGT